MLSIHIARRVYCTIMSSLMRKSSICIERVRHHESVAQTVLAGTDIFIPLRGYEGAALPRQSVFLRAC